MGAFWEAFFFALALSADAFFAGLSYGGSGIRIPAVSTWILSGAGGIILGVFLAFGSILRPFFPARIAAWVCFLVLFALGMSKILDGAAKSLIRKHRKLCSCWNFSIFHLRFVLTLYADPERADLDCSKSLSPKEAAALALSLSLDSVAAGLGAAIGNIRISAAIILSVILNAAAILAGQRMGERLFSRLPDWFSGISGMILIILAILRIL